MTAPSEVPRSPQPFGDAAEHWWWARGRAMELVEAGDGAGALGSLVSDLGKHEGTKDLLYGRGQLIDLFAGEVVLGGATGARRFIEGWSPFGAEWVPATSSVDGGS